MSISSRLNTKFTPARVPAIQCTRFVRQRAARVYLEQIHFNAGRRSEKRCDRVILNIQTTAGAQRAHGSFYILVMYALGTLIQWMLFVVSDEHNGHNTRNGTNASDLYQIKAIIIKNVQHEHEWAPFDAADHSIVHVKHPARDKRPDSVSGRAEMRICVALYVLVSACARVFDSFDR